MRISTDEDRCLYVRFSSVDTGISKRIPDEDVLEHSSMSVHKSSFSRVRGYLPSTLYTVWHDRIPQVKTYFAHLNIFQMPVGHTYPAISEGGDSWIMRYYDQGTTMFTTEDVEQIHYLQSCDRIKTASWFVGEQQRWGSNECAGDCYTLLLAAGQLVRIMVKARIQPHLAEQGCGSFAQ